MEALTTDYDWQEKSENIRKTQTYLLIYLFIR